MVYGKGSLLRKMPGDAWQQFANLRAYFGFMWAHPGKKLLFMGGELAQPTEWNHDAALPWSLLDDPRHRGVQRLVRDLNAAYRELPALHRLDASPEGFRWVVGDDRDQSVFAWLRFGGEGTAPVLVVCNFTPVPREGYRVGVPASGPWHEALNTDAESYGGTNTGNSGSVASQPVASHGYPQLAVAHPAAAGHPGPRAEGVGMPPSRSACSPAGPSRWARTGTAWASISRCSPPMPSASTSACSTPRAGGRSRACRCPSARTRCGTATCRRRGPASSTATAPSGPTSRGAGTASTRTSCCSTPTRGSSSARSSWSDALFGYRVGGGRGDLSFDRRDSAPAMPKSVVVDDSFNWGDDRPPDVPWDRTVIYEAHVRGLSMRREDLPQRERGTFAALADPRLVDHLHRLGVTAIELLPIHAFAQDRFLVEKGLRNYWGYSTLAFFAPEPRYLVESWARNELKVAVRRLHAAGIEVILDVVYNHTCEGGETGPTLSWRGLDNASYYRLFPGDERHHINDTGTGNTVNVSHPRVLQMVMDSLRYWVNEYHVDGFRFDLGTILGREGDGLRSRLRLLRRGAAGPGALAREADQRALGHRAGRLPGRQPPAGLRRVERQVPRRASAASGAATRARARSSRRG